MITIDEGHLMECEYSGRIIFCFDRGCLDRVIVEETAHSADPARHEKILGHGIRVENARKWERISDASRT